MSYYRVPAEIVTPVWEEFKKDKTAALASLEWIKEIGGKPVAFSGLGSTRISALHFDGEAPQGFRRSGAYWKPDKRTKVGKQWAEKLAASGEVPDSRAYFARVGVPVYVTAPGNWHSPALNMLKDGSLLVKFKEMGDWKAPETFEELKASEYHALIEADEEARKGEENEAQ